VPNISGMCCIFAILDLSIIAGIFCTKTATLLASQIYVHRYETDATLIELEYYDGNYLGSSL
jgi:hypothetical protein